MVSALGDRQFSRDAPPAVLVFLTFSLEPIVAEEYRLLVPDLFRLLLVSILLHVFVGKGQKYPQPPPKEAQAGGTSGAHSIKPCLIIINPPTQLRWASRR